MNLGFMAGSIVAKLTLSKENWDASIRKVKEDQKTLGGFVSKNSADFKKMGMAMTMAGGAIVASMGLMIKRYVSAGDQIDKMSKRTGFAAETLSELRYAAEISGANIESLEKAVKRMARTIIEARDGSAEYDNALARVGIKYEDLEKLNPEEQFFKIGYAIAELEDPTLRAAAAQEIFGRAGTDLLPLFALGSEGLDDLRQKAHELGIVFDKEAAEKAARLADAQLTLRSALRGVTISIAENLAPALSKLAEDLSVTIAKVSAWIKEHPKLTKIIATSTGIIGGLMVVLGPLAMMLPGIVVALPAIAAGFTAMTGPIGLVTTALALIAIRANDARNAFKRMTKAAEMEAKAAGEKISWFKKTVYGLNAAWDKYALGLDTSKLAQAAMNKEIIKAQDNLKKYEPLVSKAKDALKDLAAKGKSFIESLLGIKKASEDTSKGTKILVETGETLITNIGGVIDKSKWLQPELVKTAEIIQGVQGAFSDLSTFIYTTAIPAARDMAGVLDLAVGEMEGRIPDITAAVKTSTEEIKKSWDELHPHLSNLCTDLGYSFGNFTASLLTKGSDLSDALKGLWSDVKQSLIGMIADVAAKWAKTMLVDMFTSTTKGLSKITSATKTATDGLGKMASGLGEGIGKAIGAIGKGIATACKAIAGAAKEVAIVAGLALAIYAGFKAIQALFGKKKGAGDLGYTNTLLEEINWEKLQAVNEKLDFLNLQINDIKNTLWHTIANSLNNLFNIGKVISNDIKTSGSKIVSAIGNITSAQAGAVITSPQLVMAHGTPSKPEYFIPHDRLMNFPTAPAMPAREMTSPMRAEKQEINITIKPIVIPRADKYVVDFVIEELKHGRKIPIGAIGG